MQEGGKLVEVIVNMIVNILFILIFLYFTYHFLLVLINMKRPITFPKTEGELSQVCKFPDRPLRFPTYRAQLGGIILNSFVLLLIMTILLVATFTEVTIFPLQFLLFLPLANTQQMFNQVAITENGILCGGRFVPWRNMKQYQVISIDVNHRYYGYSREVNEGFEVRVRTNLFPLTFIALNDETKLKIIERLENNGITEQITDKQ